MITAAQQAQRASESFDDINMHKVDFGELYERPVPRAYFRELGSLDYQIPDHAAPYFRTFIDALKLARGKQRVTVLDLGCSYGVNAALLKHRGLTLRDLRAHYTAPGTRALSAEDMVRRDRAFFARHPRRSDVRVIGLDCSEPAIAYARANGLLDHGFAENLEGDEPSPALRQALQEVDLVVSTGCVGYVTEATFGHLLAPRAPGGALPWVASTVLRVFPYDAIAAAMAELDLVTQRLEGTTLVQRRFGSEDERTHTLETLAARGLSPEGRESEGCFHAELYLSRPRVESQPPVAELVGHLRGRLA